MSQIIALGIGSPAGITQLVLTGLSSSISPNIGLARLVDSQQLSTYQEKNVGITPTLASAAAIFPKSFLSFISGSASISIINPPIDGYHLIGLIFTNPTPGAILGTGNIVGGAAPVQFKLLTLIYDPNTRLYYPQGSGGSGGSVYPALTPPVLSDFTWVNQGTATAVANSIGQLYLLAPVQAASLDNWRILKKAAPAPPYKLTIGFIPNYLNVDDIFMGPIWRESGSGKFVSIGPESFTEAKHRIANWNSPTSFNVDVLPYTMSRAANVPVWIQLEDNNVNRIVRVGGNGLDWIQVNSVLRTSFITADEIGFGVDTNSNSTFDAGMAIFHFAVS